MVAIFNQFYHIYFESGHGKPKFIRLPNDNIQLYFCDCSGERFRQVLDADWIWAGTRVEIAHGWRNREQDHNDRVNVTRALKLTTTTGAQGHFWSRFRRPTPGCNNLVCNDLDDVITLWCDVKIVTPQGHALFTAFGKLMFEYIFWYEVNEWFLNDIAQKFWKIMGFQKNDKFPRRATGQLWIDRVHYELTSLHTHQSDLRYPSKHRFHFNSTYYSSHPDRTSVFGQRDHVFANTGCLLSPSTHSKK